MDRLDELEFLRNKQGLTATQKREYDFLYNQRYLGTTVNRPQWIETDVEKLRALAQQEALRQTASERSKILEEAARVSEQGQLTHIFRTPVTRNGKRVILADNTANVAVLKSLINPGEALNLQWFLDHCQEPSFDRLSWSDWLSPTQRKAQEEKIAQALRAKFSQVCRINQIAETQANFELWSGVDNPVMTELLEKPCILNEDGEILELTPASETEKQKWEQERFEAKQQTLREMAAAGDITGLRQASQQERAERSQNVAQLHRDYSLLRGFVTRQEYLLPPLPAIWNGRPLDATRIKQGGREIISQIGRKHGFERINAVLYGLDESFFSDWANKLRQVEFQLYGIAGSAH